MTPAQIELLIKIAILVGLAALGFGGGWIVNGWRLAGEVEHLEGVVDVQKQSLATYEGANERCVAGLQDVKGAVKVIADGVAARTKAAAEAMARAEQASKAHLEAAQGALNRPMPAAGKECEAMVREAVEYAKKRKGAK